MEKIRIGGLIGGTLSIDETFVQWKGAGYQAIKVPRRAIKAVTVEQVTFGNATLKLIGEGAVLAEIPRMLPKWANQAQTWLMEKLGL